MAKCSNSPETGVNKPCCRFLKQKEMLIKVELNDFHLCSDRWLDHSDTH